MREREGAREAESKRGGAREVFKQGIRWRAERR